MKFSMKTPHRSGEGVAQAHVGPNWTEIAPVPDAVAHARRMVRRALASAESEFVYDAELVCSELVTNAIRCVRTLEAPPCDVAPGIWMEIQSRPRWAHLRVRDPYPAALPVRKNADVTDTTGRGLAISEALTALLWVEVTSIEKIVNAVFARPGVTLTPDEIAGLHQ